MSGSPLIQAADSDAAWPWPGAPAGLGAAGGLASRGGLGSPDAPRPPAGAGAGDAAGYPRLATCAPARDLTAVRAAREFARATLRYWDVTERCDDLTLVLSELLTNALQHAAPRTGGWPVRVGLVQSRPGAAILCVVADASPAPPVPRPAGHLAESGRGVHVIEELSDDWGYAVVPRRGKVVWATFAAPVLRVITTPQYV